MLYIPYANEVYYKETYKGTEIPVEYLERQLIQASRHIDSLTFNRISGDINRLSTKQKEIVQEIVCKQAEFEYANKDIFDMILSGYSINGVNMQFGESWNVSIQKGIPVKRDDYGYLCQTGLCCRILR